MVVLLMATEPHGTPCFLGAWKARVQTLPLTRFTACTAAAQVDFMPVYAAHLRGIIQKGIAHPDNHERPLEGFKIVVDAGNGSAAASLPPMCWRRSAPTPQVQQGCSLPALRALHTLKNP